MSTTNPDAPPAAPRRRIGDRLIALLAVTSAFAMLLAIIGRIARDRNVLLALLMYLPILPLAGATIIAVAIHLSRRPRLWWKSLLALAGIALIAGYWNVLDMTGRAPALSAPGSPAAITVMQWNVQWGGRDIFPQAWEPTARAIFAAAPDILVLNEGPTDERIARLCRDLWDTWTFASRGHRPKSRYWYKLVVASRWPVRFEREVTLTNGAGVSVLVEAPQGALRVLVVDGISDPRILRTPMLHAIAAHCHDEAAAGRTIDLIAGDFNAMSASIGFDALRHQGYALASEASGSWRGTFPTPLPLYDIDHIWVGPAFRVAGCGFVHSAGTNHRGLIVLVEMN